MGAINANDGNNLSWGTKFNSLSGGSTLTMAEEEVLLASTRRRELAELREPSSSSTARIAIDSSNDDKR